jgi:hypothetical protein
MSRSTIGGRGGGDGGGGGGGGGGGNDDDDDDDDDELTQENSTHEEVCFTVCYNKSSDWASVLVLVSSVCAYRRFFLTVTGE